MFRGQRVDEDLAARHIEIARKFGARLHQRTDLEFGLHDRRQIAQRVQFFFAEPTRPGVGYTYPADAATIGCEQWLRRVEAQMRRLLHDRQLGEAGILRRVGHHQRAFGVEGDADIWPDIE